MPTHVLLLFWAVLLGFLAVPAIALGQDSTRTVSTPPPKPRPVSITPT